MKKQEHKLLIKLMPIIFSIFLIIVIIINFPTKHDNNDSKRFVTESLDKAYSKNIFADQKTTTKKLELFINNLLNERDDLYKNYFLEIEAIGFKTYLNGERISQDKNLAESRYIKKRGLLVIKKYREKFENFLNDQINEIKNMDFTTAEKEILLKSYNKGLTTTRYMMKRLFDLEEEVIYKAEEIVQFLHDRRQVWSVSNDGSSALFNYDRLTLNELDIYSKLTEELQGLVLEEQEIMNIGNESVDLNKDILNYLK